MAKQGFNYYKAETDRFQDIKIKRLKKRFQCTGYAVYQYLLNEVYRVRGYYMKFTEDERFDVSEYWGIEEQEVTDIVEYCAEIGLFNAEMWQRHGILTARSIQARYLDICKVSKKTPAIQEEYRLVEAEAQVPATAEMPSLFTAAEMSPMRIVTAQKQDREQIPEPVPAPVPETLRKTPEISGNIPEEIDKEKKSKVNLPPQTPPALQTGGGREAEEVSDSAGKKDLERLHRHLKLIGCTAQDWQWIASITGIASAESPLWGLVDEVRNSGGRLSMCGYVMPSLRALVAAGRLKRQEPPRDVAGELRRMMRAAGVPEYEIPKLLAAAERQEQTIREALAEIRRSKGRITMPAKYLYAALKKAGARKKGVA